MIVRGSTNFHRCVPPSEDGWTELGAVRALADDVVLACDEAATNAVEHAYRGQPEGVVDVEATLESDVVSVDIRDTGRWRVPEGADHTRGRGLTIMRAVMDDVDVVRGPGGTTVRMTRQA